MLVATWIGMPLLAILGINLHAFQVAGSIVILSLAFSMLNAEESAIKQSPEEQKEKVPGASGAIVPLAIPIIAGPGTITTLIVSVNQNPGIISQLFISMVALLVTGIIFLVLFFSHTLENLIGQRGINIFNRIGGLLLAAIAIQSLTNGLMGLFPILTAQSS
jgi:multiple antibiotic resistance protein